ncbi:MAG: hypothetical protein Q8R20_01850 [Nanoarchaeota archaeon]|nr:hypothetical protein [Nanoarchaeota archaeon]
MVRLSHHKSSSSKSPRLKRSQKKGVSKTRTRKISKKRKMFGPVSPFPVLDLREPSTTFLRKVVLGEPASAPPEASLAEPEPKVDAPRASRVAEYDDLETAPPSEGRGFLSLMKTFRFFTLFFGVSAILVFGASAYFFFFSGRFSGDVALSLDLPKEVLRGAPFEFQLAIENNAEMDIKDANLTLLVPRDILILDNRTEKGILTDSLGDLRPGSIEKKSYRLLALSHVAGVPGKSSSTEEESVLKKITVRVSYSLGGASGFEVEETREVRAGESALRAELRKDEGQVLSGSTFRFAILYSNASNEDIDDLRIGVQYPETFRYVSSNLPPDSLDNYWKLGALRGGSDGKISIQGILEGADNAEFPFPVKFYSSFQGKDYLVGEEKLGLSIAPSPIGLQVLINGSDAYTARAGDTLRYEIYYNNLSGVSLSDFVIRGAFLGEMFDLTSARSGATLDSRGRFVWDKSVVSEFRELSAGARGRVEFQVKLKDQFPISRVGDTNFRLQATIEASSPTTPYYVIGDKTRALLESSIKVQGRVLFDAKAFYRDADSGIVNSGSLPPRAGSPTEYTIHWVLRNESTNVRDVKARATLPYGVEWTGKVQSTADTLPLYDELTREISWDILEVSATKGVLSAPAEAIFQVRLTPDSSSVGKVMTLLNETRLTAIDDFTGATLQASDVSLTTNLVDDPGAGAGGGIVQSAD